MVDFIVDALIFIGILSSSMIVIMPILGMRWRNTRPTKNSQLDFME